MLPIASSFRTARQIYGRGRNVTAKEKQVETKKTATGAWRFIKWRASQTSFQAFFVPCFFVP